MQSPDQKLAHSKRDIVTAAFACLAALLPVAASAQACTPPPNLVLQGDGRYKLDNQPYGDHAKWLEFKDRNKTIGGANHLIPLEQFADFWVPTLETAPPRPLIIFAHPGGATEEFGNILRTLVLKPAMDAGFAVASLEFRHPYASFVNPKPGAKECPAGEQCPYPPSSDIGNAVQFFRHHAQEFCIDPDNIFLVGQSRGSLALLHAIGADDLKKANPPPKSPWRAQSSKVRAVWAYQAQTTYRENELAGFVSTAMYPGQDQTYREVFRDDYINLPYDPGSAYSRVSTGDPLKLPFVWLSYDEDVESMTTVTQQSYCSKSFGACGKPRTNFDVHDANFGVRLKNAYEEVGQASRITLCVNGAKGGQARPDNGYAGLIDFFKAHMNPPLPGAVAPGCVTQHRPKPN